MHCLGRADKMGIAKALMAMRREHHRRKDLDRISMLDWLLQKRQTQPAIDRFWKQVLVSAVNEELEHMAAIHGFQVFWLGFLARADAYEMGVPTVPLREFYGRLRILGAWHVRSSRPGGTYPMADAGSV